MTDQSITRRKLLGAAGAAAGSAGLAGCNNPLSKDTPTATPTRREAMQDEIDRRGEDVADDLDDVSTTLDGSIGELTEDNIQGVNVRTIDRVDDEKGYQTNIRIDYQTNLEFGLLSNANGQLNEGFREAYAENFAELTEEAIQTCIDVYGEQKNEESDLASMNLIDTARDFPEVDRLVMNFEGSDERYCRGSFDLEGYGENPDMTADEVMGNYSVRRED